MVYVSVTVTDMATIHEKEREEDSGEASSLFGKPGSGFDKHRDHN